MRRSVDSLERIVLGMLRLNLPGAGAVPPAEHGRPASSPGGEQSEPAG